LSSSTPVITDPAVTTVTFLAAATGAADMKFTVNGVEQTTGITNNANGTWSFAWPISSLKDATYTIAATAIDALGTRGQQRTLSVKLARGAPVTPQAVTGGYNYVYISGARTLVAELAWDANPEGSVTGYQVMKGSTTVCSASYATSCLDLSPASSGTTTYVVRTNYTNGAGGASYVYNSCTGVLLNFGSGTYQSTVTFPALSGGGGSSLDQPEPPTGLTVTANADGTRDLRWSPPASSTPALDFYRIYRDGQNYTNRIDTAGDTQTCPSSIQICWTDTATGGTSHTYRVTSAASTLTESDFLGPVTG
jgi:hypothetical protein